MTKPNRIVIDIPKSEIKKTLPKTKLANTPIKRIRTGIQANGDLRVVLDLKEKVKSRSFFLEKRGNRQDRIVIDLKDMNTIQAPLRKNNKPFKYRDILIAVDAGHGGEDPGAIGPKRVFEKDVVLALSKRVEALINREKGFQAKLIRKNDYYLSLQKRRENAQKMKADLMISIHADAFEDPSAKGASVYTLTSTNASSERARSLARKENESDLNEGIVHTQKQPYLPPPSHKIMNKSIEAGSFVLKSMGHITYLHKRRVQQGDFAVLRSSQVPSILVETGFISNPKEAKQLSNKKYRHQLANAIFQGIKNYYYSNPPKNTYIANVKSPHREYIIAYGDTLSEIAQRHKTSMTKIMKRNGLASKQIQAGQKLVIPAS